MKIENLTDDSTFTGDGLKRLYWRLEQDGVIPIAIDPNSEGQPTEEWLEHGYEYEDVQTLVNLYDACSSYTASEVIPEDKFTECMREQAFDIWDLQNCLPAEFIDWDKYADHVAQDYQVVETPHGKYFVSCN